jgi:hypothetical protein
MMEQNYMNSRDDGVSESIGFILIFTIVIMGIGLVTLYGYPMLLQQQTGADEQIMEKNMIVLQNDFKSLAYKTVPYKETSLKIGGGSLAVNNYQTTGPTFQIQDLTTTLMPDHKTGDLRYQSSSFKEEISLQNGAVVKRDPSTSGSVMLAEPRWFYDDQTNTMVINVVYVNSSGLMSREGIGTVQMELGETDYAKKDYSPGTNTIYIYYTPADSTQDYKTAWENYFERTMKMSCDGASPMMTCTKSGVQTIVIKKTEVFINTL